MAMQREAMTRVGEIVSLIGVMGSLIFVGLEVRQSAIATRAANDTVIAEAFREINQVMASSPELARALTSYADDPASAPGPEQVQILGLWRGLFHTWSNAHRQHLNGTIDPAIFQGIVQEITAYAQASANGSSPDLIRRGRLMRWAWDKERFIFNPDFQQFVDGLLQVQDVKKQPSG